MTRNTALSLAILAAIGLYFWSQVRPASPPRTSASEVRTGEMPSQRQISLSKVQSAPGAEADLCNAQVTWLTRVGAEVRFNYEGEARLVGAQWPSGTYLALTSDVCTGTECRLVLPRPSLSEVRIALDSCPPVEVP